MSATGTGDHISGQECEKLDEEGLTAVATPASELLAWLAAADEAALPAVVLLDGRSGSGKTTLAGEIARVLRERGVAAGELPVESLYPGWHGLADGARELPRLLARAAIASAAGERELHYPQYDWHRGEFAPTGRLRLAAPLLVEGCGAVSRESMAAAERFAAAVRGLEELSGATGSGTAASAGAQHPTSSAVLAIWMSLPTAARKARALARDGEVYAPHWDDWAAQERELFGTARPWELAHRVLTV